LSFFICGAPILRSARSEPAGDFMTKKIVDDTIAGAGTLLLQNAILLDCELIIL